MRWLPLQSVRARLWAALLLLSLAVIVISAVTWFSLERVDKRLQELHRQTLSQVAQALELSKRSTDLATSAPYLLNQRSNFLINQEGQKLIEALDEVRVEWPTFEFGSSDAGNHAVADATEQLTAGVTDLIAASSALDSIQAELRSLVASLGDLRERAAAKIANPAVDDQERLTWWALQSMTSDALNAVFAGNLIGVGEEHRSYLGQRRSLNTPELTEEQVTFLIQLDRIVDTETGVFELRRQELSTNLNAQNALFRIRHDASEISASASQFAANAEQYLAAERSSSSSTIQLTKLVVALIALASLLLALISALFVSRYVTNNIALVSTAMVQLAGGDRSSHLPRKFTNRDEIGDLFRSFRSFRANALRLDRSNRQLNQQNTLFQKVFTNISDGIAITDMSGRITAQNPAMESILEIVFDAGTNVTFAELLGKGRFGKAAKLAGLSDDHRGHCELFSDDGKLIELRASRLPDDGRVWLCADVTERRKLAERLAQIDRVETLGKVAGDTAHDFGNILSTINTHVHLLDARGDESSKATLVALNNAIEFGSSLTQRLLAFAKKQHLAPELTELNALVAGMVDLVEISLKPEVTFQVQYSENPIQVLVDPGQLESSLLNLVLNANQAIDRSGRISLELGVTADQSAYILIEDTGAGMPPDVLNRVLEPFYTTRTDDGGTGLGLSMAYGFFRQTGGDLSVLSEVGKGTQINITLPLGATTKQTMPNFQGKSALLVEDSIEARTHARRLLETCGITVSEAGNGQDAKALMNNSAFDLIVTDLDLGGGIDGWELMDHFHKRYPDKPAVVVSGRLPEHQMAPTRKGSQLHCLSKPLEPNAIHLVLEQAFGDR
ncbi:ATP-binding protein [Ruegeria hyattellae]|uniref:ATP-binding protein n=1 Tax=Ruegeria hyattellae TaxID=3233337 RepID=UPI00355C9784